jgi:ABC-type sugar transport system ATPase subunit
VNAVMQEEAGIINIAGKITWCGDVIAREAEHWPKSARFQDVVRQPVADRVTLHEAYQQVARFIGSPTMNTMTAPLRVNGAGVELALGKASIAFRGLAADPGLQVTIGIRAEDLGACVSDDAWFSGQLAMVERLITVEVPRGSAVRISDAVSIKGAADMLHLIAGKTRQSLN